MRSDMLDRDDLTKIAQARLDDAELLVGAGRYDGAVYLCGYAVEVALKARICKTLRWAGYRTQKGYQSFKTHDLDVLLSLSGVEEDVKGRFPDEWWVVTKWDPEVRYKPIGSVSEDKARSMIESAKAVLGYYERESSSHQGRRGHGADGGEARTSRA